MGSVKEVDGDTLTETLNFRGHTFIHKWRKEEGKMTFQEPEFYEEFNSAGFGEDEMDKVNEVLDESFFCADMFDLAELE